MTSRKRSLILSLTGVVFGVSFFVLTQAQTTGFESFFIKTILDTNGAIRVSDKYQNFSTSITAGSTGLHNFRVQLKEGQYKSGIEHPQNLRKTLESFRDIAGISEILEAPVSVKSASRENRGNIQGINIHDHLNVSGLSSQIIAGDLTDFVHNPNAILVGSKLAQRLGSTVGDNLKLNHSKEGRNYTIAGIYESGVSDIDKIRVYMHLPEARSLTQKPFGESIFQISIKDPTKAPLIADHIEASLLHSASSWQEREKVWLDVFKALRISAGITVFAIIVISGLGIFNTLVMIVMEKTKEIAILRSMGFTQWDIKLIFLIQGLIILVFGTLLGWILGALSTFGISKIPLRIRGIFSTDSFVVNWQLNHYLIAAALSLLVVLIASYLPARRAAKLEPGQVVRGTHG